MRDSLLTEPEQVHATKHVENGFDLHKVLHDLKHYLPSQTPLKDFIHHNSLHAFQHMRFYDGIFKASKIFGYKVTLQLDEFRAMHKQGRIRTDVLNKIITDRKGKGVADVWKERLLTKTYDCTIDPLVGRLRTNWKSVYKIDLDNLVQPLFFRILCSYLDQGVALKHFPFEDTGLLNAVRTLEKNSFASFFKTKRAKALLMDESVTIEKLLSIVVGDEGYFEQYLYDQQFGHRGWSGMASTIEDQPQSILYPKKISLQDVILFELLLEIDALDSVLGQNWKPLALSVQEKPLELFPKTTLSELDEVFTLWQDAFEWSYYDQILAGVKQVNDTTPFPKESGFRTSTVLETKKTFQAIFCIDEREDSLRRHVESVDTESETLGCPGFFGVEFFFQPEGGQFLEKLCPAPVTPQYLIKEFNTKAVRKHDLFYTKNMHTFFTGFLLSLSLGLVSAVRLLLNLFRPTMSPAISDAFAHMDVQGELQIECDDVSKRESGLQVGFTITEMVTRVENLLRGIGMVKDFAPIVYVVGHGSSSANNPHHGAHDCGACSGRPGATNARVFAFMANHKAVRVILSEKGLNIPDETQFVGAMHDTAADQIGFYDEQILTGLNAAAHKTNKETFENALDLNAKERSRRFASINTKADLKAVREEIRKRSVSLFEPRPELGHGTNALCFVGKRNLTKGLFLDRRAFLNSYDYKTDPEGKLLLGVMRPLPPVCGGINLEYYFSRVDNYKLGCGTKLPHNVMGLIGVANSSDGDLRPGLPWQMIEPHDPVRLMIVVEHYPEVVLKTVQTEATLYEWFINDWVHLTAVHPDTNEFYYFKNGAFTLYKPLLNEVKKTGEMIQFIEKAKEMESNDITGATHENIPVHVLN
jgi:uncharacterized protein